MKIQSTIDATTLKKSLFQGTSISALGALLFIVPTLFLSIPYLSRWGLYLFTISFFLIAIGMLPYKRLLKLQITPHVIEFLPEGIALWWKQKKICFISFSHLASIVYQADKKIPGIQLHITGIDHYYCHKKIVDRWQQKMQKKYRCDFFIPYISQKSYFKAQKFLEAYLKNIVQSN